MTSRKIGFGLIGLGGISSAHLDGFARTGDFAPLVAVCDRIAVMSSGRLTGIVDNGEGARARIGELMLG